MNRAETARLLALAAAFDRRTVGEADVLAWHSVVADLDYADAEIALRDHFAETTDYLMPAMIRRRVRAIREQRAEQRHREILRSELRAIEAASSDSERGISKVVAAVAAARGLSVEQTEAETDERRKVRAVGCPYCGAAAFRPCRRRISETETEPLRAHHPSRIERANA